MSIRRVNHGVLSVRDLEVATPFYRDVLGLVLIATLPGQPHWPEMRFLRAPGTSRNHHDIALIATATDALPARGQPRAPGEAWQDQDMWRQPLDYATAGARWGMARAMGAAAGEPM